MLRKTLDQMGLATREGGSIIVNYPKSPRKSNLSAPEVEMILGERYDVERIGGTASDPVWKLKDRGESIGEWWRGEDGKWRFEIDDRGATLNYNVNQIAMGSRPRTLGQFVNHPELFKAYPELKDMPIDFQSSANSVYHRGDKSMTIGLGSENLKESLFHEVQHAVQEIEGFARGGSPEAMAPRPGLVENVGKLVDELSDALEIKKLMQHQRLSVTDARKAYEAKIGRKVSGTAAMEAKNSTRSELQELYNRNYRKLNELADQEIGAFENYRNLPGEREAREVGRRSVR
jgi:hypothetical protein